jgi:hypothetical protein
VAVRAQDAKALESVVAAIAVDVIELDWNDAINRALLRPPAELTAFLLEAGHV